MYSLALLTALPVFAAALPQAAPAASNTASALIAASTQDASSDKLINVLTTAFPKMASCDGRDQFEGECADAATAAPFIMASFKTFGITNANEQAAALAIMAVETGYFAFSRNHFGPFENGQPGQGTRNMQQPNFNDEYAAALFGPQSTEYQTARNLVSPSPLNQTAEARVGDNAILALNNGVASGFPSAAWFIQAKCSPDVRAAMQAGGYPGYHRYLQECVQIGSEISTERDVAFTSFSSGITAAGGLS